MCAPPTLVNRFEKRRVPDIKCRRHERAGFKKDDAPPEFQGAVVDDAREEGDPFFLDYWRVLTAMRRRRRRREDGEVETQNAGVLIVVVGLSLLNGFQRMLPQWVSGQNGSALSQRSNTTDSPGPRGAAAPSKPTAKAMSNRCTSASMLPAATSTASAT